MATEKSYDNVTMNWNNPNKAQAMATFKQQCEMMFRRNKIDDKQAQVNEILVRTRQVGIEKFNSWALSKDDRKDPEKVWERFEEYRKSNQNFRVARLSLRNIKQNCDSATNDPEPTDEFISRLHLQSAQCCFKSTKAADETNSELNERVIEQLIAGTCLPEVQKDLLAKDNKLTLNKAVQIARFHEVSARHMKQLHIAQGASNSTGVSSNWN